MSHEMLSLSQAARHVCIPDQQLYRLALQKEVPCVKRSEQYFFEHRDLDEWAQRRIMRLSPEHLAQHHRDVTAANAKNINDDHLIESLMNVSQVYSAMDAKTKPGIIRDMAKAAAATNMVNDEEFLISS